MPKLTAHPGVTLIRPKHDGRANWRVRYTEPSEDGGRTKWETIDRKAYPRAADRIDYAKRISERIRNRQRELDLGAVPMSNMALGAAIEKFYSDPPRSVSTKNTLDVHRLGTDRLLEWAKAKRIETTDQLTRALLIEFASYVAKQPKQYAGCGGKTEARELRSPATVNKELRSVRRVLSHLVDLDLCARLTQDDLRRALKQAKVNTERKDYLRPNELKKLIEACERHDAATYSMTRREKGDGKTGGTPRYEPISAFVLFIMLSGMRREEVLRLKWSDVDLDALDHEGRKVGEVHVRGTVSKTGKARDVDLAVSPALRRLLVTMRLESGGRGHVFKLSKDTVIKAMRRLRKTWGAPPKFSYQVLRVTCSTFLCNAPGIYGGASAFMSARQLGHSVIIAERHYAGRIKGISPKHRTLEAAMQIEPEVAAVIERTEQRRAA